MIELLKEEMHFLKPLVEGKPDIELWACVEGNMGRAWVDSKDCPKLAVAIVADFCYILGRIDNLENELDVKELLNQYKRRIIIADEDLIAPIIEKYFSNNHKKFSRYAIKTEPDVFQRDKLNEYMRAVETEFSIEKINKALYYKALEDEFMADCCSFFSSSDDFLKNGIGYVIVENGEIIAGASSYSYCSGSIDITIGTKEKYRKRGLALACASKLILDCLDKNIYPRWDAANPESVKLAEKLGYHFDREYTVYSIR